MARDPENILVLRLGGIGEALSISAALRAVRGRFPKAWITLMAEQPGADLVRHWVDEVVETNAPYRSHGVRSLFDAALYRESLVVVERILRREYDLFLDFHHLFSLQQIVKPFLVALLSRARRRIGFDKRWAGFFLTDPVPDAVALHMAERTRAVLRPLGIDLANTDPIVRVSPEDRIWARSLEFKPPLIAISPGANNPDKRWDPDRFAAVARRLSSRGQVVVTGTRGEREMCARIPGINLAGEFGVGRLAALLERCALLVATDSGPVHIAYALGTPVVGIFFPRAAREWGAYRDTRRFRVLHREGPGEEQGRTLPLITVEEVLQAAEEMLEDERSGIFRQ